MEVILAEYHGFCYGVKRAVKMAQDSAHAPGGSYTLGPIIHNPQMVERLAQEGVGMVSDVAEVKGGTMIIRSHGVGPDVYDRAGDLGLKIVDATCPHVKKAQMAAHDLKKAGCQVVIVGEKKHPEVKSIFEWSEKKAWIVETTAEAEALPPVDRLGVVAQTTFSGADFQRIVDCLEQKAATIQVERTICNATEKRQASAVALAKTVDLMIVIGGKNSANTTRLAELCQKVGCKTVHIETAKELSPAWLKDIHKVGVTAGASTPDWLIEEVRLKVQEMNSFINGQMEKVQQGDIVQGKVVSVQPKEIFVDIGYKSEGVVPIEEAAYPRPENLGEIVAVGDCIDVYVMEVDGPSGLKLSKTRADKVVAWDKIKALMEKGEPVQAKAVEAVKGGVALSVFGIRGFVPASQLDLKFTEDVSVFVGQTLEVLPIEIDREKNRAVFSRRVLLEKERQEKENALLASLNVGQTMEGTVKRLVEYGAFIDIGGMDGLAHISDLSWERVKSPQDVVSVGDHVTVLIKKVDFDARRISLSLKEVTRDPWLDKIEMLKQGAVVTGKISKIADFGAFVKLPNDLEGLIRLSELSEKRITRADEVVSVGDETKVKIIHIDKKAKRIALSITKAQQDAERAEFKNYMSKQTLKSDTLGDKFGHLFKNFSD